MRARAKVAVAVLPEPPLTPGFLDGWAAAVVGEPKPVLAEEFVYGVAQLIFNGVAAVVGASVHADLFANQLQELARLFYAHGIAVWIVLPVQRIQGFVINAHHF